MWLVARLMLSGGDPCETVRPRLVRLLRPGREVAIIQRLAAGSSLRCSRELETAT